MPDEVIKHLYLTKEFAVTPCIFQSMFLDAMEKVLEQTHYKMVKEEDDATIRES